MQKSLPVLWILLVIPWSAFGEGAPDAAVSKVVGEWKSGLNNLSIRKNSTAVGSIFLEGKAKGGNVEVKGSAGVMKLEVDGDNVFVNVLDSKWKLSLSNDKSTLTMEMVEGKVKLVKITFTRDKPKETALAKARDMHTKKAIKALGTKEDGHFLFALEELGDGGKALGVTITLREGRAAAVDEIVEFLVWSTKDRQRSFQAIARFEGDVKGLGLATRHQEKLQSVAADRLKQPSFGRDPLTSDLEPKSDKAISQRLTDGICVRYYPFR